ncbi:584_t:CDS:2, partial [Gigaspora rosea]
MSYEPRILPFPANQQAYFLEFLWSSQLTNESLNEDAFQDKITSEDSLTMNELKKIGDKINALD